MATTIKFKRSKKSPKTKDRTLWFADKKLGTCYKVKATPYASDNTGGDESRRWKSFYWVKPHNALVSEVFHIGQGLAEKRENAYSWLIGSLTDDLEKLMWNIRRAASEIA